MAKQLQITIPTPCQENWENMTPEEKGRFCDSCQKQVIDFSGMSDRQLAEFFKKPSNGSVCGRFMTDQLDRAIAIPRKRIPWLKYFFQITIPAFLISIKASAQKKPATINVVAKDPTKKEGVFSETRLALGQPSLSRDSKAVKNAFIDQKTGFEMEQMGLNAMDLLDSRAPFSNKQEIWGKVAGTNGEAIPFASIELSRARKIIVADSFGVFAMLRSSLGDNDKLVISSAGYETDTIQVGKNDYLDSELKIQLKNATISLQDVVVTAKNVQRAEYALGGAIAGYVIVTSGKNALPQTCKENGLIIYPNPVQAGGTVQLDFRGADDGYYRLQLLSQSGQAIRQQVISFDEVKLMTIDIPQVAAGTYILALFHQKTGHKFSEKIIIQ